MNLNLIKKQVVVTGGTRGIGLAIAKKFLEEGAIVHVMARNENAEFTEAFKTQLNSELYFYKCDVCNEQTLAETRDKILKNSSGTIDILIANAGSGAGVKDPISATEEWNRMWNLNFNSALFSARIFETILKNNYGNIIFISSIAGINYSGAPTDYSVSKAALISLAKNLSFKLAPEVRVNCIAPGNIYFEGGTWDIKLKEDEEKVKKMLKEKVPLGILGNPEDIANMALFLGSEKASNITGACIVIDGGQTTNLN